MLSSLLIYDIKKQRNFCLGLFRLVSLNELCVPSSSSGSITKRALIQARARTRAC
ncbi:hypothetical protein Hanom_Chr14g01329151 [Helianthus anomalus]